MPNPLIAKEQIPQQVFKTEDVLPSTEERNIRTIQLQQAFQSNRSSYSKAKIVFETAIETLEVIDHVWEITDMNVLLKGGITLPISSIKEVGIIGARVTENPIAQGTN